MLDAALRCAAAIAACGEVGLQQALKTIAVTGFSTVANEEEERERKVHQRAKLPFPREL